MRIPLKYNLQFLDDYWIRSDYGINSELHTLEYVHKHFHTFYEIVLVLKGDIAHYFTLQQPQEQLEYSCEHLRGNTVQIVPPELIHYYRFAEPDTEYINLTLSRAVYEQLAAFLDLKDLVLPATVEIPPEATRALQLEFQGIFSADYDERERAQLHKVLAADCLKYFFSRAQTEDVRPQWLIDLLICLQNPHNLDKDIEELVQITHYSHSQLCKLFKKHMGVSLQQYLSEKRLEHACFLLKNSDIKIITVASILGYESHSYFSKIFSQAFGISPLQYRRKFKK